MPLFLSSSPCTVLTFPARDHYVNFFFFLHLMPIDGFIPFLGSRLISLIKTIEDVENWDMSVCVWL
jgi:hypothetical protein